jgi:hypothetical protein
VTEVAVFEQAPFWLEQKRKQVGVETTAVQKLLPWKQVTRRPAHSTKFEPTVQGPVELEQETVDWLPSGRVQVFVTEHWPDAAKIESRSAEALLGASANAALQRVRPRTKSRASFFMVMSPQVCAGASGAASPGVESNKCAMRQIHLLATIDSL